MPELCAFDDAPTQFPKLFDDEENLRFQLEDGNVAADWFGSISPSSNSLFGGLNPKQPDAFSNIPVGAVFDWEDSKQSATGPSFGSLCGETDYYNYFIGNMSMSQLVDSKETNIQEFQAMCSNKRDNSSSVEPKTLSEKSEQVSTNSTEDNVLRVKHEKTESKNKVIRKSTGEEKKKRGRPRLSTGQETLSPMSVDLLDVNLSARALVERPSNLWDTESEGLVTIGSYSKALRRAKIERFKAKKLHTLQYGPHLRFAFRRQFAGARPRVGGRFIKMHSDPFLGPPPSVGVGSDSDMMLSRDELLSAEGNSSVSEGEFFFSSDDAEHDEVNLSNPSPQGNDPFYNELVHQYAALFTQPDPQAFAPFPFNLDFPTPESCFELCE
jgi:hypothetical protein